MSQQSPSAAGAGRALPWTVAATSFVWPAGVAENCHRLAGKVDEVSLIFFETASSLSYTEEDLPASLAELGLSYHLHLPLDLDWQAGPEAAFESVRQLVSKVAFLRPRCFVLHPPRDPDALAAFLRLWRAAGWSEDLLYLENIKGNDLAGLWPLIRSTGCRVCLDLGHLLEYGQQGLLALPGIEERISMLHLYAPEQGRHTSLASLSPPGRELLRHLLQRACRDTVMVLEVFSWPEFQDSLDIFTTWFRKWEIGGREEPGKQPKEP
jgi:sugar phosphate isomerase/epimerase